MRPLKRKQIYLSEKTDALLKKWSLVKGVSEAFLIREAVSQYLAGMEADHRTTEDDPLSGFVGRCPEPGKEDAARNHDDYLYRGDGE